MCKACYYGRMIKKTKNKNNRDQVIIREMTGEDCDKAADLLKACFTVPWSVKDLKEALAEGDYLQLLVLQEPQYSGDAGAIIGYAGLKTVLDEGDITNVCIRPARRGRGIGGRLVETMLARASKQGIKNIYLEVRASNVAAIALYRKAGFEETGIRKGYYDRPSEDALLMAWHAD